MLYKKRHDLITRALAEANQRHGYTPLQSLMDRANDLTLLHAEARGDSFPYTRSFICELDRLFKEAYMSPPPPRRKAPNPGKRKQWTH